MLKTKIKIDVFDAVVHVVKAKKLKQIEAKYNLINCDGYDAVTFRILKKNTTEYCVAFEGKPKIDVVHHEVTHLVNFIFQDCGVKLDLDNDETQAYFSAYMFRKVLKAIKKK